MGCDLCEQLAAQVVDLERRNRNQLLSVVAARDYQKDAETTRDTALARVKELEGEVERLRRLGYAVDLSGDHAIAEAARKWAAARKSWHSDETDRELLSAIDAAAKGK